MRLRAGVERLEVEVGRFKGLVREERLCRCCSDGCVEDEEHFLVECVRWEGLRGEMWGELLRVDPAAVRVVVGWVKWRMVDWVLRGGNRRVCEVVMRHVTRMVHEREIWEARGD